MILFIILGQSLRINVPSGKRFGNGQVMGQINMCSLWWGSQDDKGGGMYEGKEQRRVRRVRPDRSLLMAVYSRKDLLRGFCYAERCDWVKVRV